jgi:hypothetical protein
MANPNEFTFGRVDDLPGADYLTSLDYPALMHQNAVQGLPYGSSTVFDAPDFPHALIRLEGSPPYTPDAFRLQAANALQHFQVLEAAGVSVPDHRRVIAEHGRIDPKYPRMYTVVRRITGELLPDVNQNRETHTRRVVEAVGTYHVWALTSGNTDVLLLDSARAHNYTIEDPSDPQSQIWAHDIEPWFTPVQAERGSVDHGRLRYTITSAYELSRTVHSPPRSSKEALRVVESRGMRILRAIANLTINRTEYEHDGLSEQA